MSRTGLFGVWLFAGLGLSATGALAQEPRVRIEGIESQALRDALDLAVGIANQPAANRFEARRWANESADSVEALLRSEGFYASEIVPDVTDDDANEPVVTVNLGPQFKFDYPNIEWIGAVPAAGVQAAAEQITGITIGSAGRAADVLAAEGRILAVVQKRGHADASPSERQVIVDHAIQAVQPNFRIDAGERVILDGLRIQGTLRTKTAFIEKLAPWTAGAVYDPDLLADLDTRLRDTGVFDSVGVSLPGEADSVPGEPRQVVVSLVERARRTLELGVGFSTIEGPGLDVKWSRYNQKGVADTVTYILKLAQINSKLDAEIALPHWRKPQETLKLGTGFYDDKTDAYDQSGFGLRADLTTRFGSSPYITSFLTYGASLDISRTYDKVTVNEQTVRGQERNIATMALLAAFALDRSDDPLDPRKGWRLEGRFEPTALAGDAQLVFGRVQSQASYYYSFDEKGKTVLATRGKLGAILGGDLGEIPASRRLYSGGGSSVRGFDYQGIGPKLPDGTPQGGLSLMEGSLELRRRFQGPWGAAVFLDAGTIGSDAYPTIKDLRLGIGAGIRYDLGFGPIRVDVAMPLDQREGDEQFALYLSIGQAF